MKSKTHDEDAGRKLHLLCQQLGFEKDADLVKASGLEKTHLSKLFHGNIHNPRPETIVKLLKALSQKSKVPIDKLWKEIQNIYQLPEDAISLIQDRIKSDNKIIQNKEDKKIKHNLPSKPEVFFGRKKEIDELNKYFIAPGRVIVISGMGGIGKTTLALESAHQCLNNQNLNFDAIIFSSAKTNWLHNSTRVLPINTPDANLTDILNKISSVLGAEKINREKNIKRQCELAYEELKNYRTLLIVDNLETIEDQEDVLGFLYDINLPQSVTIMITTRDSSGLRANISLGSLELEDSLKLIQRQINLLRKYNPEFSLNKEEQRQLQKAAGGVPIVIEYSIGLLAEGYRLKDILNILKGSEDVLADFLFKGAIKQLQDKISHKLLLAMNILRKPFRRDAIVSISGLEATPDLDISHGFVQLCRLSLIRDEGNEIYSISSLTHNYAHAQLKKNKQFEAESTERWVKYYIELAENNGRKNLYDWEKGNWAERFDVLEGQWENLEAVIEFCVRKRLYDKFKSLWVSLNNYTEVYGKWYAHFRWLEILAEQAENNSDEKTTVFAKSAIARVHIREGSNENLINAERLLEEARKLQSFADFPVKIELFENQIMLNIERKEYSEAAEELRRLEKFVQSLNNISNISDDDKIRYKLPYKYRKAQVLAATGNREKAKAMFRETIEDAKEIRWILAIIGPQNRLADLLIEDNELEKAKELLDSTLAATQKNKYYRRTAYCHFSLGHLHHKKDEGEQAKVHFEEALKIFKRLGMLIQQRKVEKILKISVN